MKVFIYVQHLLGIGHFTRMRHIADALLNLGHQVLFVNGGKALPEHGLPDNSILNLPSISVKDQNFKTYLTAEGREVDENDKKSRQDKLCEAFLEFNPDILLVESYPFGRHYFSFELLPLLQIAKAKKIPRLCSIRDILVKRSVKKEEKTLGVLHEHFTHLLIHGDPDIISLNQSFTLANKINIPIFYTGYIQNSKESASPSPFQKPIIIVSAGGGAVGKHIIHAAISVADHFKSYEFYCLTGHNISNEEFQLLQEKAPENVILRTFDPDFKQKLNHATLSISQAGYNTAIEILMANCRSIFVPFETESETEQKQRAEILVQKGFATLLTAQDLASGELKRTIDETLHQPKPAKRRFKTRGVQETLCFIENFEQPSLKKPHPNLWQALSDELQKWQNANKSPCFWWRDDDVVEETPALQRLIKLQQDHHQTLYLAAIPKTCSPTLSKFINAYQNIYILQHGYAHKNHAKTHQKKIEIGGNWSIEPAISKLLEGKEKLETIFQDRFVPIFVPPWNRIDHAFYPFIYNHYQALSVFKNPKNIEGIAHINTQIDIIDWKKNKACIDQAFCLAQIIDELQKRRNGLLPEQTPLGILTHHLDHDEQIWGFLEEILSKIQMSSIVF